ncbi:hypothetical protein [Micromonospora sp. NPDC005113]
MTTLDLGDVLAHTWSTPAPTAGPGDPPTVPWPTGPCVTPANLGLDDDLVAHALHTLGQFGTNTLREAKVLLSMWERRDQLTDEQVTEVLAYYRPAPKAVA